MRILRNPPENTWPTLTRRPTQESEVLESQIRQVISTVRKNGDQALREFTLRFDGVDIKAFAVTTEEVAEAIAQVADPLKEAIGTAAKNITTFHQLQQRSSLQTETMAGVSCWRNIVPISRIGIYVPGGSAPLFSTVLMLGIPAQLAKCQEVILCTPPGKDGKVNPAILYAAKVCGIEQIYKVGGAQAIAAMAYGTGTIRAVNKIFGPGNQYVTMAKLMVSMTGTAIDLPAGPSEVLVIADAEANAAFIAADLLSQAEHGADSQVVLLSIHEEKIKEVLSEVDRQLATLPRKEIAKACLSNSLAIYFSNPEDCIKFSNAYAPEHLILQTRAPEQLAAQVTNAGSVFLGPWSPESVGDYASGTNHTLPTQGHARTFSGVSLESFQKTITFQQLTEDGLRNLGPTVEIMAEAEALEGHRQAVSIRLNSLR